MDHVVLNAKGNGMPVQWHRVLNAAIHKVNMSMRCRANRATHVDNHAGRTDVKVDINNVMDTAIASRFSCSCSCKFGNHCIQVRVAALHVVCNPCELLSIDVFASRKYQCCRSVLGMCYVIPPLSILLGCPEPLCHSIGLAVTRRIPSSSLASASTPSS